MKKNILVVIVVALAALCCEAETFHFRGGCPAGVTMRQSGTAPNGVTAQTTSAETEAQGEKRDAQNILVGRVTKVHDGDMIWIDVKGGREKIRLYGIDAPEINQKWGVQSRKALARKIYGKKVTVEPLYRDPYDRLVGRVKLGDVDVNEWMIAEGHAWWYEYFAKDEVKWGELQKAAREAKIGLWSQPNPINPYRWRKLHQRRTSNGND